MASRSIDRASSPEKSSSAAAQDSQSGRTSQVSTAQPIGAPGANTGLAPAASSSKSPPPPTFRVGKTKTGAFGKVRSTASEPCPVCGRAGCSYSDDRELLVCWRGDGGSSPSGWRYLKPGASGGLLYARSDTDAGLRATLSPVDIPTLAGSSTWAAAAARYVEHRDADTCRRELAQRLGVSPVSLAALSVGWKPGAYGVGAWTYPQRAAAGEIVSVGLRLNREDDRQRYDSDGGKTKSPPGLLYSPGRWLTLEGPVLSVEGMSDVAALDTLGLDAVGHPGNNPRGALLDELEKLLRKVPDDRPIVAVAERDPGREDDPNTGGQRYARSKAQALANRLGRPIGYAFAPDRAKDSRDWVRKNVSDASKLPASERTAIRARFVEGLLSSVVWFQPEPTKPEPPSRLEKLAAQGLEVELDDYRREMRERLSDWVSPDKPRGRLAVLAGPAGSGKTRAVDEIAVPAYEQTASGIPTHENVAERRAALLRLPILDESDVAAFPKLDATTCASFTQEQADTLRAQGHRKAQSAEKAQRYGLGVRGTACVGCPLAPWRESPAAAVVDQDLSAWSPDAVFGNQAQELAVEETSAPPDEFSEIRCSYWREVARADAARVKIATLERLRRTASQVLPKDVRGLLTLDERAFETICPTARADAWILDELADALEGAALRLEEQRNREKLTTDRRDRRDRKILDERTFFDTDEDRSRRRQTIERDRQRTEIEQKKSQRREDQIEHVRQLSAVARQIADRLREKRDRQSYGAEVWQIVKTRSGRRKTDAPTPPRTIVVSGRAVKQPARVLSDVLERSLPPGAVVNAEALELVRRAHARHLDRLVLLVEELDGGAASKVASGERRTALSAIGTWTTKLPDTADVLLLDGSLDVAALSKRLGRDIENISPTARVRRRAPAIQFPVGVTRRTSIEVVARIQEQAFAALPNAKRIGLILLGPHEDALYPTDPETGKRLRTKRSRELVPDDVFDRIARDEKGELMVEHFGGGRDRSSNEWLAHCDALVVLGTPRPRAVAVVEELVRRCEDAALEAGSAWGQVDWEARTIDGRVVRCKGRGYLDPTWAAAADAVTRTGLYQSLERARTVLDVAGGSEDAPGGLAVLVVSDEPCGLPVVDSLPAPLSKGARTVASIVRRLVEHGIPPEDAESRKGGKTQALPGACATRPIRRGSIPIERVALVETVAVPSTVVLREVVKSPSRQGGFVSLRQARNWIAEAVAAGLIVQSGSTSAKVYGLPCPQPVEPRRRPTPGSNEIQGPTSTSSPPTPSKTWTTGPTGPTVAPTSAPTWATGPSCPQRIGRGQRIAGDTGPPKGGGGGAAQKSTQPKAAAADTLVPKRPSESSETGSTTARCHLGSEIERRRD